MSTQQPATSDDRYADALRTRFDAAAPAIAAEPTPIIARARRHRRQVRTWGALSVVAALVAVGGLGSALANREPPPAETPPPPEPASAVSIWLSAESVPEGTDMVAVVVNDSAEELVFGATAELERWDGTAWVPSGGINLCLPSCTPPSFESAVPTMSDGWGASPTPGNPGPAMRFSTDGLDDGWYRLVQGPASGVFEIADDAPAPAPLWSLDTASVQPSPALTGLRGTRVALGAVTADVSDYATVERWDGAAWQPTTSVPLSRPAAAPSDVFADIPGLEPGEFRLVLTDFEDGEQGESVWGNFWVAGAETGERQRAEILETRDGAPPEVENLVRTAGAMYTEGAVIRPDEGVVEVVTTGSSSCPSPPHEVALRDGVLVVYLGDPTRDPDEACTDDAPVTTYVVRLPAGMPTTPVPDVETRTLEGVLISVSPGGEVDGLVRARIVDQWQGLPDHVQAGPEDWVFGADADLAARTFRVWTTGTWGCPNPPTAIEVGAEGSVVIYLGTEEIVSGYCNETVDQITYVVAFPDDFAPTAVPTITVVNRRATATPGDPSGAVWDDPCEPGQTDEVCALNLWLDELLVGAGFTTSFWDSYPFNGSRSIVIDGVADIWAEAFPAGATSEVFPLEFVPERSARVGIVDVEYGTFEGNSGGPGGQFTCGGVWVRLGSAVVPAEDAEAALDALAAQVTTCPADVDELVAHYADVMNP